MNHTSSGQEAAPKTAAEVERWLTHMLRDTLKVSESSIDVHSPFQAYGLDSSALIGFTDALGNWLGRDLDPTLVYDNPSIHALARAVTTEGRR